MKIMHLDVPNLREIIINTLTNMHLGIRKIWRSGFEFSLNVQHVQCNGKYPYWSYICIYIYSQSDTSTYLIRIRYVVKCPTISEKYVTGYACKGNQPTGAIADLFQDMVYCADESSRATAKSLCSKLLIGTVKRDVSSVEASYELSGLPLYRSSHTFQSVSLTGFRAPDLSKPKSTVTKNTILDKYLNRDEQDKTSLYSFICRQGKVPVISTLTAPFPLEEEYCRINLLMHWPN